jgi:hypothetical protein
LSIRLLPGWIHALYLPPSYDHTNIYDDILAQLPSPTLAVLGDVNTKITHGNAFAGPAHTTIRARALYRLATEHGLVHTQRSTAEALLPPCPWSSQLERRVHTAEKTENDVPKNHHVFTARELLVSATWTYSRHTARNRNGPFKDLEDTDHGAIVAHIVGDAMQTIPSDPGVDRTPVPRFQIARLRDEETCKRLRLRFGQSVAAAGCDVRLETLAAKVNVIETDNRLTQEVKVHRQQELINDAATSIDEAMSTTCLRVLNTYDPTTVRHQKDKEGERLAKDIVSSTTARLLIKRARRGAAHKAFMPSPDPSLTPHEHVIQHYTGIYTPVAGITGQQWQTPLTHQGLPPLEDNDELLFAVSPTMLHQVIGKYPIDRSGGADGLHAKIYRVLADRTDSTLVVLLSALFATCVRTGLTPQHWNAAYVSLLPKVATPTQASDFRPISLTLMIRRYFESCVYRACLSTSTAQDGRWMTLHDAQAGFRRGYSTITHLLCAHECPDRIHIFLDIKAAYDRVPLGRLWQKLINLGAPRRLIALFQALLNNCTAQVVVNGTRTHPFVRKCGLMQGSLLSPLLFNVFINDLIIGIDDALTTPGAGTPPPARQLMFADDIKLATSSYDEAQVMVKQCDTWAQENGMQWGINKCAVLGLREGEVLSLVGVPIPRAREYKYLGAVYKESKVDELRNGFDWKLHADRLITKGTGVLGLLKSISAPLAEGMKAEMWRMFGRSTMDYAAGLVWSWWRRATASAFVTERRLAAELEGSLQKLHKEVLCWVVGPQARKNPIAAESLLNLPSPLHRWEEIAFATSIHINKARDENPIRRVTDYLATKSNCLALRMRRTHNIHHDLCAHPARAQWRAARIAEPRLLRRTFLRRCREARWSSPQAPMTAVFITPKARRYADMDGATLEKDGKLRRAMLRWRMGTAHGTALCAIRSCTRHGSMPHDIGRACITALDADTLMGLYANATEETAAFRAMAARRWMEGLEAARAKLPVTLPPSDRTKYSALDDLLNNNNHHMFGVFWRALTAPNGRWNDGE